MPTIWRIEGLTMTRFRRCTTRGGDVTGPDEDTGLCPECRDGKHRNCIGWTLNVNDDEVPCACPEIGCGDA